MTNCSLTLSLALRPRCLLPSGPRRLATTGSCKTLGAQAPHQTQTSGCPDPQRQPLP